MGGTSNRIGGLGAVLAMLALVLQICVPGGFMVTHETGVPALVICTGHGAFVGIADDHGRPAKAPAPQHQGVCAFAGHGFTTLGDAVAIRIPTIVAFDIQAVSTPADRAPGRGLAAPPPPAQAPPHPTV